MQYTCDTGDTNHLAQSQPRGVHTQAQKVCMQHQGGPKAPQSKYLCHGLSQCLTLCDRHSVECKQKQKTFLRTDLLTSYLLTSS